MRLLGRLEPEMTWLEVLAPPGTTAVDVGANRGVYTYALAQHCSAVHAVEPQPWCATTIRSWGNPKVRVHEVALSDHSGMLALSIPLRGRTRMTGYATAGAVVGPHDVIEVPVVRLDDLALGPVSLIKIDVEGHELAVLRGASTIIGTERPNLLVEIEERHLVGTTIRAALDEVCQSGYAGFFLDGDRWRSVGDFDPARDQPAVNAGVRGARYINLFAFQPSESVTLLKS